MGYVRNEFTSHLFRAAQIVQRVFQLPRHVIEGACQYADFVARFRLRFLREIAGGHALCCTSQSLQRRDYSLCKKQAQEH